MFTGPQVPDNMIGNDEKLAEDNDSDTDGDNRQTESDSSSDEEGDYR